MKMIYLILLGLLGIWLITMGPACRMNGMNEGILHFLEGNAVPALELMAYFPQKEGTTWYYYGYAEYAHRMALENVTKDAKYPHLLYHDIAGELEDTSGGEATSDFTFRLQYIFTPDSVDERILKTNKAFPHRIPYLRLLALPLRVGMSWRQRVRIGTQSRILTAKIVAMECATIFHTSRETIKVRYRVPMDNMPGGYYEEIRVFAKGLGVYSLQNTFSPNSREQFGYGLSRLEETDDSLHP